MKKMYCIVNVIEPWYCPLTKEDEQKVLDFIKEHKEYSIEQAIKKLYDESKIRLFLNACDCDYQEIQVLEVKCE